MTPLTTILSRNKQALICRFAFFLFIIIGSPLICADTFEQITPIPFHKIEAGGVMLEISVSKDKGLVSLFLHKNGMVDGIKSVVENTFLPFSALLITTKKVMLVSFSDKLIIADTDSLIMTLVPNWTAASMYLSGNVVYAEMAFEQAYGEGFNIVTYKRTEMYKKTRPFDIRSAIEANKLK